MSGLPQYIIIVVKQLISFCSPIAITMDIQGIVLYISYTVCMNNFGAT